jgi:hypothetical protein
MDENEKACLEMLHGISKPRRLAADFINIHSVYLAKWF